LGLGGYLTWTAAAREIRRLTGDSARMFPVEKLSGGFLKIIKSDSFKNNPDFITMGESGCENNQLILPLILNNPDANYCKEDGVERAYHRFDSHIIEQICECYGIENPELKCVVNLTNEEKCFAEDFHISVLNNEKFITIEPFSKDNYTPNREYPFEKWQKIVDTLSEDIKIVQVGNSGKILNNVIPLAGETTFREAIAIIERSSIFVASESGLVHGATAVDTKSLVVITGYQDERMVAYPQNINVNIGTHGPCGMKIRCQLCKSDADNHDHREILNLIKSHVLPDGSRG
jgi:hypothetical protein